MTDNTENLILEHLKRFQSGQERIERELKEIKTRLGSLEAGQGSVVQHLGHLASSIATCWPTGKLASQDCAGLRSW